MMTRNKMEQTIEDNKSICFYHTKEDTWVAYNPKISGTYGYEFFLDDINITKKIRNDYPIEVTFKPVSFYGTYSQDILSHYINTDDDQQTLSIDTYREHIIKLEIDAEDKDDYSDEVIAYKKFSLRYQPIYVKKFTRVDYGIRFSTELISQYAEIVPWNTISLDNPFDNPKCTLTTDFVRWFKQVCDELDIEIFHDTGKNNKPTKPYHVEIPHRDSIRFAKLNGEYLGSNDLPDGNYKHNASYNDCVKYMNDYKQKFKTLILGKIKLEKEKQLTKTERKSVVAELSAIESVLNEVIPTKATTHKFYSFRIRLAQLKKLLLSVEEEN